MAGNMNRLRHHVVPRTLCVSDPIVLASVRIVPGQHATATTTSSSSVPLRRTMRLRGEDAARIVPLWMAHWMMRTAFRTLDGASPGRGQASGMPCGCCRRHGRRGERPAISAVPKPFWAMATVLTPILMMITHAPRIVPKLGMD
jgi:hypothetical protein